MNTATHYCQLCGNIMHEQGQQVDYRKGHEGHVDELVACQNATCKLYSAIFTVALLLSGDCACIWSFTPMFDLLTGKELIHE